MLNICHIPFKPQQYLHNIYFEIIYGGRIETTTMAKSLKMDEPKIGRHCLSNL
jgi:hypothetical protein